VAVFSEDEKSRIYHYLGYPKQNALDQGLSSGYAISNAASMQYLFDALNRISEEGAARVREDLRQLVCIDQELIAMRGNAGVLGAGEVKLDAMKGRSHLKKDRNDYVKRLGDDLGVMPNYGALQFGGRVRNT
jgi:hypothetical protein